jgi:hypothetical protein
MKFRLPTDYAHVAEGLAYERKCEGYGVLVPPRNVASRLIIAGFKNVAVQALKHFNGQSL